jgi:hypothetical protein
MSTRGNDVPPSTPAPKKGRVRSLRIAPKLRRSARVFTTAILPQMRGAASFGRLLDGSLWTGTSWSL